LPLCAAVSASRSSTSSRTPTRCSGRSSRDCSEVRSQFDLVLVADPSRRSTRSAARTCTPTSRPRTKRHDAVHARNELAFRRGAAQGLAHLLEGATFGDPRIEFLSVEPPPRHQDCVSRRTTAPRYLLCGTARARDDLPRTRTTRSSAPPPRRDHPRPRVSGPGAAGDGLGPSRGDSASGRACDPRLRSADRQNAEANRSGGAEPESIPPW